MTILSYNYFKSYHVFSLKLLEKYLRETLDYLKYFRLLGVFLNREERKISKMFQSMWARLQTSCLCMNWQISSYTEHRSDTAVRSSKQEILEPQKPTYVKTSINEVVRRAPAACIESQESRTIANDCLMDSFVVVIHRRPFLCSMIRCSQYSGLASNVHFRRDKNHFQFI